LGGPGKVFFSSVPWSETEAGPYDLHPAISTCATEAADRRISRKIDLHNNIMVHLPDETQYDFTAILDQLLKHLQ
jgi:hypothetical protein